MNVLERRAIKRATKRLSGQLRSGEELLDFDVCSLGVSGSARVDVIASNRAVYLAPLGSSALALRIPLTDITWIHEWPNGAAFAIQTRQGDEHQLTYKGRPRGVRECIEAQLLGLSDYDGTWTSGLSTIAAGFRPWRPDRIGHWALTLDGEWLSGLLPGLDGPGIGAMAIAALEDEAVCATGSVAPGNVGPSGRWDVRDHTRLADSALRVCGDLDDDFDWTAGAVIAPPPDGGQPMVEPALIVAGPKTLVVVRTPESRGWLGSIQSVSVHGTPLSNLAKSHRRDPTPEGNWVMELGFITPKGRDHGVAEAVSSGEYTVLTLGINAGPNGEALWKRVSSPANQMG